MVRVAWVIAVLLLLLAAPARADLRLGGNVDTAVCAPSHGVGIADFDHDGNLDVVAGCVFDGTIRFLRGNGDGTFVVGPPVGAGGGQTVAIVPGDFNRDGNPDVAVSTTGPDRVGIFTGNGAGGLTAGPSFGMPGLSVDLAVADFDGNGTQDIAASAGFPSNTVQLFQGNGAGGFTGPSTVLSSVTGTRGVVAGDFNGDGRQDIAASADGSSSVSVGLGQAGGGFVPAPDSGMSVGAPFPAGIDAGDLDGDGDLDLVTGNASIPGSVTTLLGSGSGGFAPAAVWPNANSGRPDFVAVGDLDGDGHDDVVHTSLQEAHVRVRLSDGRGRLRPPVDVPTAATASRVRIADMDRDGAPDVVASMDGITVLRSLPIVDVGDADFGSQTVLRPGAVLERRVVNRGEAPLRVTGVMVTGANAGDFAVADGCAGLVVPPDGSCALGVRFTPGATGARAATLDIASNAGPETVALTGTGVAADAGPQGPPGPPGAAGSVGGAAVPRLLLAALTPRLAARVGKRVTMRYATTAEGPVTLEVLRGKRRVARLTAMAKFGVNAVRWNGRVRRGGRLVAAAPGRYVLRLIAVAGAQQEAVSAVLRIRRR